MLCLLGGLIVGLLHDTFIRPRVVRLCWFPEDSSLRCNAIFNFWTTVYAFIIACIAYLLGGFEQFTNP